MSGRVRILERRIKSIAVMKKTIEMVITSMREVFEESFLFSMPDRRGVR